ncbi:LysR family transcriptional regulator [Microvirga sp. GCM10011540]|uniref:LysR family transcriptional regulator n=1 Tax=Microvirga sp. GCM10011540 TaxID=3317338 RepID=UPI003617C21A
MTLSLRHVEVFHAVMSAGGATQAANLLRTSQPTVSRELKELERLVGFPLFTRKGRRLLPTEAALSLHAEVRRSFVGLEEITRTADAIRANASAHIKIACLPAYGSTLLPPVCRSFLGSHDALRLSIHSVEQGAIATGLSTGHYDIGILEAAPALEGIESTIIDVGEELCILPKGHPLTRKAVLEPCDFEGEDFIYFSADDAYRRTVDDIFQQHAVTRRLRVEATTATSICSLVSQGLGVSIINPISALYSLDKDIELRRLSVSIPYVIGIYRPANRQYPDLARRFGEYCMASLNDIRRRIEEVL